MTPLAMRVMNELTLPVRDRTLHDPCGVIRHMDDVHCFDCTAVYPMAAELLSTGAGKPAVGLFQRTFLPAERTWIEYLVPEGRVGFLLIRDAGHAQVIVAGVRGGFFMSPIGSFALLDAPQPDAGLVTWTSDFSSELMATVAPLLCLLLAFINTPKVVGRRTHLPHVGFQRRLARSMGLQGKFPLRAWTEIKLEVRPSRDDSDASPRQGWLGGRKALHFVRMFGRFRLGRFELVSEHWRGDASLGIKQSRYIVVPPRDGVWPAIGGAA